MIINLSDNKIALTKMENYSLTGWPKHKRREETIRNEIQWSGNSLINLLTEGPNYDYLNIRLDFKNDELNNELFNAILNLRPRSLTIINNKKGVSKDWNPKDIIKHINFQYLSEINFENCYRLREIVAVPEIASKIRRLIWGSIDYSTIDDAIPIELSKYNGLLEFSPYGIFCYNYVSKVVDYLKVVLKDKPNLMVFNCNIFTVSLKDWLSLMPQTENLQKLHIGFIEEMNQESINGFFDYLQQQKGLREFYIDTSSCNKQFKKGLSETFMNMHNLRKVSLPFEFSKEQWKILLENLRDKNLTHLYLDKSNLNDEIVDYLTPLLKNCNQMRTLSLNGTKLTDKGLKNLLDSIQSGEFSSLDFSGLKINDHNIWINFVQTQDCISQLWCLGLQLTNDNLYHLVESCDGNDSLNISINSINSNEELINRLIEGLREQKILKEGAKITLDMSNEKITQNYVLVSNSLDVVLKIKYTNDDNYLIINVDDPSSKVTNLVKTSWFPWW